ncbi:hypothetical protein NDU88_004805 [Pleurodeles waltl]|uniref:Uncharacterized protein n=1 Tax=Pleurodeles waltl TaxID=8319 RepID=A0AAV7TTI0_PLEWA|nr:hypothetical protein NDU88_004805 [Pleurodeles waltl]
MALKPARIAEIPESPWGTRRNMFLSSTMERADISRSRWDKTPEEEGSEKKDREEAEDREPEEHCAQEKRCGREMMKAGRRRVNNVDE